MITGGQLRACTALESVGSLLSALGYSAVAETLDGDELRRLTGILIPERVRLCHFGRYGNVDFIGLQAGTVPGSLSADLILEMRRRNSFRRQVVFALSTDLHELSIVDVSADRRVRRLTVSTVSPKAQDIDRLNAMEVFDYQADSTVETLIDRALDRETVTRQFFLSFKEAVSSVDDVLRVLCKKESSDSTSTQALLFLSRILFLYFIQEKGWLDRNRHFLIDRVLAAEDRGQCAFTSTLRPLFFGCLNTPAGKRTVRARKLGTIPYLNGGLFEPSAFELRHPAISLPNEVVRRILESAFERFSFSVEESESELIGVDPEMLGKVFESLMEGEERLRSGSYYTPRPIVDALTSEALIHWCSAGDQKMSEVLRTVVRGEQVAIPVARAREILARVGAVRILDPACGSGAFLLSALKCVERLTVRLSRVAGIEVPHDLRQRIVERSLFGVDIKPQAVRLCELRLWLAIVSSSTSEAEDVPPLPNLDRNIQQGNSLLGPLDFLGAGRREIYQQWSIALRTRESLIAAYRHAPRQARPAICRKLRQSDLALARSLLEKTIDSDREEVRLLSGQGRLKFIEGGQKHSRSQSIRVLEARITETERVLQRTRLGELDFFSYETNFADVISRGGFEVVIGNPPWVRGMRMESSVRQMYAARYPSFSNNSTNGIPQSELAVAFVEKSLSLTRTGGVVSLLIPAKILTSGYGAALRSLILREHTLLALRDWSDEARRLFAADTFPLGLTVQKGPGNQDSIRVARNAETFEVKTAGLSVGDTWSEWSLEPAHCRIILNRIRQRFRSLREVLGRSPVMGVKTGNNRRFFIDEVQVRGRSVYLPGFDLELPFEALCRCVRGRDIRRWKSVDSMWMLWPPSSGWHPSLGWPAKVAQVMGVPLSELRLAYVRPEHLGVKVAWKDVSRGFKAAVLPADVQIAGNTFQLVPNQTAYSLDASSLDEAYMIAAVLNSVIVDALMVSVADRAKDYHYRYFGTTVAALPFCVPDQASEESRDLVRLSRRAHYGEDVQREIDCLVGALFGLSDGELEILRAHVQSRLGLS
ncbi:MAG: N-6 DNA methylase [Acidobacteriota bacterium]